MKQQIISVTGRSGSGKTTLIEKLIVHYKSLGKKVSVIKSMRHEFDTDPEGKDTFRYRESGASASIITNGKKFALISEISNDENPIELAEKFFSDSDVIIIEGFKEGNQQKIEVIGDSKETPLFHDDKNIKILVTDKIFNTELPVFRRDDVDGVLEAIEKNFNC
ncbi:MAG TPA: molybdopterin-guanine dinucleotide biosynthesis protein B [Spirochaetota bacterium]|nr:molybdopterin-guanine dinucleotide biosynthesis protein B [Spirochaetota bacterium]HPS85267.1 molybdopterin-guanine dinucleotide biosynthesis protein B [Spirochaetota bacterium]